jgi:hypothetical protein
MTVIYVGTDLAARHPDITQARGVVCDTGDTTSTMVDFGEHGDLVIADEELVLAGGQRVVVTVGGTAGVTSDVQDAERNPTHRTNVIWDDGDVSDTPTDALIVSDVPTDDDTTVRRALTRRADAAAAWRTSPNSALDRRFLTKVRRYDDAIATINRRIADATTATVSPTLDEVEQENAALRTALRAALAEAWHGDDCELGHMARNPVCNCWRADALKLIPDAATEDDE